MWKFSFHKLLINLTSRKFMVWVAHTVLTWVALIILDGDKSWFLPLILVNGVISFVYLAGDALVDSICKLVEKAELKLQMTNNVNTTIDNKIDAKVGK